MPIKPPAQPQRTQSAEEFYKVWIAQHPKLLGKSVTWPVDVCLFEFAEAYAQSLKQAAPPQAESPKDEVDYNECCCEDGYKMICPQHGAPQTLAVGHGVEMADDCAHRALDRLGVPRDGKGLYLRMQWLKDQIPKPIYPQYGTNSQTSEDYVRACEAQGIGPNILALTEPVTDPSKEELKAALGQARDYVVGLSAYLATCATATIIENLETTITSLHKERDYLERLLSGDGKE